MGATKSLNLASAPPQVRVPIGSVSSTARASSTPAGRIVVNGSGGSRRMRQKDVGGREPAAAAVAEEQLQDERARLEQELECDRKFFAYPPDDFIRCPSCSALYAVNTSQRPLISHHAADLSALPACYSKDLPLGANLSIDDAIGHMHRSRFRCTECNADFCLCKTTPYHWGFSCDGWQRHKQHAEQACPVGICRWCSQPCMRRLRRSECLVVSCCGSDEGTDLQRFPPSLSCVGKERRACGKRLECGHWCGGVRGERTCPPCLRPECISRAKASPSSASSTALCSAARPTQKLPSADEWCSICWTEPLGAAPVLQLACGHFVHHHCADAMTRKGSVGGRRLTFKSIKCPLCQGIMQHPAINNHVNPQFRMYEKVRRKALQRWVVEQRGPAPKFIDEDAVASLAMQKMMFFQCSQCNEPYYGGEIECVGRNDEEDQDLDEDIQAALAMELVCRGCASKGQRQCAAHGTEFLGWKCRYCCEREAHYFCFGTTHFCHSCHDMWQSGVEQRRKLQMGRPCLGPGRCILGGRHPVGCKNGRDEYALGCSICAQDAEVGLKATGDKRTVQPMSSKLNSCTQM